MKLILALVAVSFVLAGCGDSCSSYSEFSCSQIDKATYNVYFYYPSDVENYLGRVKGLAQCGSTARGYAASKSLLGSSGWGYVCCMEAKGSSCYEKHR